MKKNVVLVCLSALALVGAFGQGRAPSAPTTGASSTIIDASTMSREETEHLQLAISDLNYPVTPGDIYQLTYRDAAGAMVSRQYQIDGISILDLGVFGKVYALNMAFYELKQNVELMISRNYTNSTPSLSIIYPGVFRVAVRESASRVRYVTAWGLSRISDVVDSADVEHVSRRNVERVTREGKSERFDLLRNSTSSADGADPLVRPGDTIVLSRAERTVEVRGEVRRPGNYELLGEEGLRELLEQFGEGFTRKSDTQRIQIIRFTDGGQRIEYVSLGDAYAGLTKLNDGDIVVVGDKSDVHSIVWFEGAVSIPRTEAQPAQEDRQEAETAVNGRFYKYIREGVMLSDVLQEIKESILPTADMGAALITSPGSLSPLVLDIRPLLSRSDLTSDIVLKPNSRVFIPINQSTVSVAGAVIRPGVAAYLPGAPASYYVSLCGGIDPERNSWGALIVYDQYGRVRKKKQAIQAGDSIFVKNNDLGYLLRRDVPTVAAFVTAALSVVTLGIATGFIDLGS